MGQTQSSRALPLPALTWGAGSRLDEHDAIVQSPVPQRQDERLHHFDFLRVLHERLSPATYLQIGVRAGTSLAFSRCRSIGVDPAYNVTAELDGDISLVRTISDEFFSRPEPLERFGGRPVDLAVIDGLHLFEFALRDFINVERHATPSSVVVFDDAFPRTADEAARKRHTESWTGDVYKLLDILQQHRPDLTCLRVGTEPTGLLVVVGLDPTSTVLADAYDGIVREHVKPDPQLVPADILSGITALPPQRVLDTPLWQILRDTQPAEDLVQLRGQLREVVRAHLGERAAGGAVSG
jgi:hypothetical protein